MAPRPDRPKGERPRRPFSRPDGPARGLGAVLIVQIDLQKDQIDQKDQVDQSGGGSA